MTCTDSSSFFHYNICSLPAHYVFVVPESYLEILSINISVIGLSETRLADSNHDLYSLSGYNHVENHRNEKSGGGVSLFIRNDIRIQERKELSRCFDKLVCVYIEIDKNVLETKT